MQIELMRFRVKPGKSARVDRWMETINTRITEAIATLARERMYVEVILREQRQGDDWLYWFILQGDGGESLATSPHDLDRVHRAFLEECLDREYGQDNILPHVLLLAPAVSAAIGWTTYPQDISRLAGGETPTTV
jgi:hypothetical protein